MIDIKNCSESILFAVRKGLSLASLARLLDGTVLLGSMRAGKDNSLSI
jgi:chromosome segregation and condensation protein ScpB